MQLCNLKSSIVPLCWLLPNMPAYVRLSVVFGLSVIIIFLPLKDLLFCFQSIVSAYIFDSICYLLIFFSSVLEYFLYLPLIL